MIYKFLFFITILFCGVDSLLSDTIENLKIKDLNDFQNKGWVYIFEDESSLLEWNNITKKEFKKINKTQIKRGYSDKTIWILIPLENEDEKQKEIIVSLRNPFLQTVNFYFLKENEVTPVIQKQGILEQRIDSLPNSSLMIPSGKTKIYIQIKSSTPLMIPILIGEKDNFYRNELFYYSVLVLLFGITL
ncbi:MAG: hypothetical protein KDK36_07670, partial [Leptospiraceae bacterium]|nr:hypothetical protein [Leptospiraceae bacterium]